MKLVYLSWECFGTADLLKALEQAGHESIVLTTSQEELLGPDIGSKVTEAVRREGADGVIGFNFFPGVAEAAHGEGYDYFSWVYDNPCVQLYSYTASYPTSRIFVFDSDTYLKFHNEGFNNIGFLPMAADPDRLASVISSGAENVPGSVADISFVGAMYHEEHDFYTRMMDKGISPYAEGYIRGLIEAQKHIYGADIIEGGLTDRIIEDMHAALPLEPQKGSVITQRTLFGEFVLDRRITAEERLDMLTAIGERFGADHRVELYTRDAGLKIGGVVNRGMSDFAEEAPRVYCGSRINLNISLRSIVNGAPLRCFEIMGAGGFLLSSYAGDLADLFIPGEEYVYFESPEDLLMKCAYYLEHEDERAQIAENGLAAIRKSHTYLHRMKEMLG